ncbi:hypothetical protein ASPACDRAFT_81911 [Aspergillus aculeatus ATCC 16872]|uniref:Uncharacterized protein n=1 Tax=Aspergillus aculeatus (strain ATCC 16872 / CBS 172.66 / WB 5094) TaxID=690307 RepID=A0A1L9WGX7_ASPA1|nr:uncharacterized protein ASPACDRAFT_81911 [Aspergillus aculeatus ATCC 16872]OJJ95428.1 hypothetical protein ASPACDRAFT_81911 [Aspergillus aculeatus ATCC 16872]
MPFVCSLWSSPCPRSCLTSWLLLVMCVDIANGKIWLALLYCLELELVTPMCGESQLSITETPWQFMVHPSRSLLILVGSSWPDLNLRHPYKFGIFTVLSSV